MKNKIASVALLALLAGSLVGCANAGTEVAFQPGSSIVIGEQAQLENLNSGVATGIASSQAAANLAYLTMPSFYGHASSGELLANSDFGTVTRVSNTTVDYKLTGKARWSDGKPVTGNDLNLSVVAAKTGFDSVTGAGFNTNLHATSLAQAHVITVSANELKLSYSQVPADWQTNLPITAPAHLIAPNGLATTAGVAEAAKNYNEYSAFTVAGVAQTVAKQRLITAGAYLIKSASPKQVRLVHNPNFVWGQKPVVDKITIDYFNGPGKLLAALKSGAVDLATPQETATTSWQQISDAVGAAKGTSVKGVGPNNELVVLNHNTGATFSADTYNGDSTKAQLLAMGFMHFIPRSGIYNTLLAGSALSKTDSFAFANGSSNYSSSVEQNGTSSYAFQNQELAQENWQKAGFARKLTVRVLFDSNNPRGQLEYAQLAQWGKVSGFNIQNVSTNNVNAVLLSGGWDVLIGAFPRADQSLATAAALGGGLDGLSAKKLNSALTALGKEPDPAKRSGLLSALDQQLVASYAGLPLFELPSMIYTAKKLGEYQPNLGLQNLTWGYPFWSVSTASK